jgi:hypothetical protein
MELVQTSLARPARFFPFPISVPVRAIAAFMISAAIMVPFIPVVGPLSLDDILPVFAVMLGALLLVFSRTKIAFDATIIGFALLALLGVLSAADNAVSLADFARLAGRSTGRFVFFAGMAIIVRALFRAERWPERVLALVITMATLQSLFGLWAFAARYQGPYGLGVVPFPDWSVLKGSVRIQGTFSGAITEFEVDAVSANFLAAYLVMTVPLSFAYALYAEKTRTQLIVLVATALQLAVLYLTYTRAALVALGAPILVMGFLYGRKKTAIGALLFGVALTLAIPSVRAKFTGEDHNRYALWWASLAITRDHPVFGVGDGNYDRVLHENQEYHLNKYGTAATASHNSILLSAAHLGIAGAIAHVLLYAALVLFALRAVQVMRGRERLLAVGIAGAIAAYLVQDQFNNLAYVPKVATQLWFLFAVLGALRDRALLLEARS